MALTNLKVALIRTAPPNHPLPMHKREWGGITLNLDECVDKGIKLIKEAAANGAHLVAFPELWFPGFPKWREINDWKKTHLQQYIDNSLELGTPQWNRLIEAIKEAKIWTALAFSERKGDHIYMAQALINPKGELIHHRQKLRPSGSERDMFSDGDPKDLKVIDTDLGRVSMLECAEHFYPTMTFAIAAQRPKLHIGALPFVQDLEDERDTWWYNQGLITRAASNFALMSGAYVLMPSVGYCWIWDPLMRVLKEVKDSVPYDEQPFLYYTFEGIDFHSDITHNPDHQISWATLQQMIEVFPEYIPKEKGELVPKRNVSCAMLKKGEFEWSEIAPATPNPAYVKGQADKGNLEVRF